jgi:hypothetical protein
MIRTRRAALTQSVQRFSEKIMRNQKMVRMAAMREAAALYADGQSG